MVSICKRDRLFRSAAGIMQGEDVPAEFGTVFEAEGVNGTYETSYIATAASLAEVTHFLLLAQQQLVEDGVAEFNGILETECLIDAWSHPEYLMDKGIVFYY